MKNILSKALTFIVILGILVQAFLPTHTIPVHAKSSYTPLAASYCGAVYNQFCIEYYNNTSWSGTPVANGTLTTSYIAWDGWGSPETGVNADNFSARYIGNFYFEARTYRFSVRADDAVYLYVDGVLKQSNSGNGAEHSYIDVAMSAGYHQVRADYIEVSAHSVVNVFWDRPYSTIAYYSDTVLTTWRATLYSTNPTIDINWDLEGPCLNIDGGPLYCRYNNFSVRSIGEYYFTGRQVTFSAGVNDGIRVWVDSTQIMNEWRDQDAGFTAYYTPTAGYHTVKVEYYERIDHARIHFYWNDTDAPTAGHVELSNYGWTNTSIDAWALAGMDFYGNQSTTKCGTTNPPTTTVTGNVCGPINFTSNGTIYYQTTDTLGNASAVGSYSVNKIDKTAPTLGFAGANTSTWYNANKTITPASTDSGGSGILSQYVSLKWHYMVFVCFSNRHFNRLLQGN